MPTDRKVVELAQVEYLARAELLNPTGEPKEVTPEPRPILSASTAREPGAGNPKAVTRREAKTVVRQLLRDKKPVPSIVLQRAFPSGKSKSSLYRRALESTGLKPGRKTREPTVSKRRSR